VRPSFVGCCPGGNGINVGASGITIDLKGFTLRGDLSPGHSGIDDAGGYDDVTVKNGVLRNFAIGVFAFNDANEASLSNLAASGNTAYGMYIDGAFAMVKSSTASGNAGPGIRVVGDGAKLQSLTASRNVEVGIWVIGGSAGIQASTASGNGTTGIAVQGGSGSVSTSTASGNALHGIAVTGEAPVIMGNRAETNGFEGGSSDFNGLGILAQGYTTAPVGTNVARSNDAPDECAPAPLC
jgi:hypothetical protein